MYGAPRDWLLTFHLVGAVTWMGALLVLVRMLRFHAAEPPSARPTLSRMEARVDYGLAIPGALLSIVCGAFALRSYGVASLGVMRWLDVELALGVVVLMIHLGLTRTRRRVARQDPAATVRVGGRATSVLLAVLLVAIVAVAVHRPMLQLR